MDVPPVGIDTGRQIIPAMFCGIDPGSQKFGLAVGDETELAFSAIIPMDGADEALNCVADSDVKPLAKWTLEGNPDRVGRIERVWLGNGTGHPIYEKKLADRKIAYALADERMTTLEARQLYWSLHPPSGLFRLLPASLCVPPRAVDDLAAWAILRRAVRNA